MGGKGQGKSGFPSKRKMHLKGLRKGLYILVSYREKKAPGYLDEKVDYEGTIVDKRVGKDHRESYVELGDCRRLNPEGEIVAQEGVKRLFDAFIDNCEEVEKVERLLSAQFVAARSSPSVGVCQAASTGSDWENSAMGAQAMMQAMATAEASSGAGVAAGLMPAVGMGGLHAMGMPMGLMPMMGMGMSRGMGGLPMGMMPMQMPMQMLMQQMSMQMLPMQRMQAMQMMGMMPMGAPAPMAAAQMAAAPVAPMAAMPMDSPICQVNMPAVAGAPVVQKPSPHEAPPKILAPAKLARRSRSRSRG